SIIEELSEKHGVYTHHAWGMTETSPLGVFNTLKPGMENLPKESLDAIKLKQGRPLFGVDLRIVDDSGEPQPWDGESTGEVRVRGNWVCSGYYRQEDTGSHDENGYFCTGDVASVDADGYMRITDRTKDIIKSGGEWISSIELENAAVDHPSVAEAAVIGIPHPKWSERPLLIIVKEYNTDLSAEEILAYLSDKVAKWWLPDDVEFVNEIPHTATGKISKKDLRKKFADLVSGAS
ncbi:MAG TPA: long-chain fatty acid--CoA ligase, partial [Porticoccus sp.]|nr:long-chain fatty acid--CoA ligase [Porticoccus sp.]